jgi:hypothetical protein
MEVIPTFEEYSCISDTMDAINKFDKEEKDSLMEDIMNNFKEAGVDTSEGVFSSMLGAAGGALIGPAIGKAVAGALGVEKGALYDLLTSRLVAAAIGKELAD